MKPDMTWVFETISRDSRTKALWDAHQEIKRLRPAEDANGDWANGYLESLEAAKQLIRGLMK